MTLEPKTKKSFSKDPYSKDQKKFCKDHGQEKEQHSKKNFSKEKKFFARHKDQKKFGGNKQLGLARMTSDFSLHKT